MATKKNVDDQLIEAEAKSMDKVIHNPLMMALRENDKKNLFQTNVITAFHKTGFHVFDYYFGAVINVHDETGKIIRQDRRIGQTAGTFNEIIGTSGTGKTTLGLQITGNIIRQYENANAIVFDCENRTDVSRCEIITKLPSYYFHTEDGSAEKFMIKSGAVGLDTIQEMIVKTYVAKMRLKKELMFDSGFKNEFNKPILIFPPTVILIDSITTVLSETFSPESTKEAAEAEKMRSNTEGARDAKTLKGFFKDILPLCKEANIIVYAINHINTNMSMGIMPVAKQQNFLKQDEILPGGKTMIYYPCNIIKLISKPSDDFTEEGDGFAGHIVVVEPIKSSTNQSGNTSKGVSFEMVFSYKNGFDPLRTLILYGKEYGIIEGNKTRLKFKDDDSFTFSLKNIYQEKSEKPIWENLKKYVIPHLDTHLPFLEPNEMEFDDRSMDY